MGMSFLQAAGGIGSGLMQADKMLSQKKKDEQEAESRQKLLSMQEESHGWKRDDETEKARLRDAENALFDKYRKIHDGIANNDYSAASDVLANEYNKNTGVFNDGQTASLQSTPSGHVANIFGADGKLLRAEKVTPQYAQEMAHKAFGQEMSMLSPARWAEAQKQQMEERKIASTEKVADAHSGYYTAAATAANKPKPTITHGGDGSVLAIADDGKSLLGTYGMPRPVSFQGGGGLAAERFDASELSKAAKIAATGEDGKVNPNLYLLIHSDATDQLNSGKEIDPYKAVVGSQKRYANASFTPEQSREIGIKMAAEYMAANNVKKGFFGAGNSLPDVTTKDPRFNKALNEEQLANAFSAASLARGMGWDEQPALVGPARTGSAAPAASAPPAKSGISAAGGIPRKPAAIENTDPLSDLEGKGSEQAREKRQAMAKELEGWKRSGDKNAQARIKELQGLIERIDNRAY